VQVMISTSLKSCKELINCLVRSARWLASMWLFAMVSIVFFGSAEAGQRKCDSNILDRQDDRRLDEAIKMALPGSAPAEKSISICKNTNSAAAFVKTVPSTEGSDTQQWWTLNCSRDRRSWHCEAPEQRRKRIVTEELEQVTREIEIEFDAGISADEAKYIVLRTFEILDTKSDIPKECHHLGSSAPEDAETWAPVYQRYELRAKYQHLAVTISTEDPGFVVWLPQTIGLNFKFKRSLSTAERGQLVCWSEYFEVN
jgi:hypothetical protein